MRVDLNISNVVSYFSYLLILKCLYHMITFVYKNFIRKRKDLITRYGKNTWAIITGGSDGIGKAISEELAKTGFNIILIARTEFKLKKLSESLKEKYKINAEYIVFDFDKEPTEFENYLNKFDFLFKEEKEISILVNNIGTVVPNLMINTSTEDIMKTIKMNCYPQLYLTKIFTDHFILRKNKVKRDSKASIINLSSLSAEIISSFQNVYGPTKRFNDYMSKGLYYEFNKMGIDVLSVRPAGVVSPLSQLKEDFFVAISADKCAKSIVDCIGYDLETNGYFLHTIYSFIISLIPEFIVNYCSRKILGSIVSKRVHYE